MHFDIVAGFRYVLIDHWYWWLAFTIAMLLGWYFLARRTYKEIDGKLYVRHWRFGKWVDVEKHMKEDHGEET